MKIVAFLSLWSLPPDEDEEQLHFLDYSVMLLVARVLSRSLLSGEFVCFLFFRGSDFFEKRITRWLWAAQRKALRST